MHSLWLEVSAADIDYVGGSRYGTPLGDPIEVRALGRVLGENREQTIRC